LSAFRIALTWTFTGPFGQAQIAADELVRLPLREQQHMTIALPLA
jgi:hypothetical protein